MTLNNIIYDSYLSTKGHVATLLLQIVYLHTVGKIHWLTYNLLL